MLSLIYLAKDSYISYLSSLSLGQYYLPSVRMCAAWHTVVGPQMPHTKRVVVCPEPIKARRATVVQLDDHLAELKHLCQSTIAAGCLSVLLTA